MWQERQEAGGEKREGSGEQGAPGTLHVFLPMEGSGRPAFAPAHMAWPGNRG